MKPVRLSSGRVSAGHHEHDCRAIRVKSFTVYPLPEGTLSCRDEDQHCGDRNRSESLGRPARSSRRLPKLESSLLRRRRRCDRYAAARERGIPVTNTPAVMAEPSVPDLAIGMMLASAADRDGPPRPRMGRSGRGSRDPIRLGHSVGGTNRRRGGARRHRRALAAPRPRRFEVKVLWNGQAAKTGVPYERGRPRRDGAATSYSDGGMQGARRRAASSRGG